MKTKRKYCGAMLRKRWAWSDEWGEFIDYWGLDPEKFIKVSRITFGGFKRCKLKNLPKYKSDMETLMIDIESPNAIMMFFVPCAPEEIGISAVSLRNKN